MFWLHLAFVLTSLNNTMLTILTISFMTFIIIVGGVHVWEWLFPTADQRLEREQKKKEKDD